MVTQSNQSGNKCCDSIKSFSSPSASVNDQLVSQESSTQGAISWKVYQQYCQAAGGLIQATHMHALACLIHNSHMVDLADGVWCDCVAAAGWVITFLCILNILLMIGSTAFSNWWLSYWLGEGSGSGSAVRTIAYYQPWLKCDVFSVSV